jgi:translocator protein
VTGTRVAIAAGVLVVVLAYAALSVRWTSAGSAWYRTQRRPAWQPPDLVFGVIWPLNFGALAVAGLVVALERPPRDGVRWLLLLVASVGLALGWAHAFYVRHALGVAALLLAGAAALTWLLLALTHSLVPWAGWALVPYAVWLSVATGLAVAYRRLAGRPGASADQGSRCRVHPGAGVRRK